MYPLPPLSIVILSKVLESVSSIIGDTLASGDKVGSDGYAKESSIIFILLISPIVLEFVDTNKFFPSFVVIFETSGNTLYSLPLESIFSSLTLPFTFLEVVEYFRTSHSDFEYDNFSGFSLKKKVNVVLPIPDTVKVFLYSLSFLTIFE